MKKIKYLVIMHLCYAFMLVILFLIPVVSNAAVNVTKNVYANNGSVKFSFTGLTLDKTHEYEFGLTPTSATEVSKWYLITEYTETEATIDITGGTEEFQKVIKAVDTGYITIKDKTTDTTILQPYAVDLSISYLNVTNYNVISNGKDLAKNNIQVNFWNASNSKAYYQYEKITDENIINKFKEIKNNNGDYNELESLLKTKAPLSNWNVWGYWNGYGTYSNGYGYTERTVSVSDNGLYYMWIYLAGNNVKNLYGYILVDNLQPEIALDSISLPKTKEVELGKALTLRPTFNPETTTNKIVTWSSSDESVATIDNAGKITPKKIGSTIITVTSKDGNKKDTCTVTVIQSTNNNEQVTNNSDSGSTDSSLISTQTSSQGTAQNYSQDSSSQETTQNSSQDSSSRSNAPTVIKVGNSNNGAKTDNTTVNVNLPNAGTGIMIITTVIVLIIIGAISYIKYNKYKDI